MRAKGGPRRNPNTNTIKADRPTRDRPAACVFAQQYSSATFLSMRLLYSKEKLGSSFKRVIISISYFFIITYV